MRHHVAQRDLRLAVRRELGPPAGDGRVELEHAALDQPRDTRRGDALGGGEHDRERVLLPRPPAPASAQAAPEIDDGRAAAQHAYRRAHLAVRFEVAREGVAHGLEARRDPAADLRLHRRSDIAPQARRYSRSDLTPRSVPLPLSPSARRANVGSPSERRCVGSDRRGPRCPPRRRARLTAPHTPPVHLQALAREGALRLLHRAARQEDPRRAPQGRHACWCRRRSTTRTAPSRSREMVEVGQAGVVRSWTWVTRPREKQPLKTAVRLRADPARRRRRRRCSTRSTPAPRRR